MNSELDIKMLKGIVRRRKKSFMIPFMLISILVGVIAFVVPPIYRSETTISIEGQQIPEHYVKTTITSYVEERLQAIQQQIMSRSKLMEIIDRFNLYSEMLEKYPSEDILDKMREAIELKTISARIVDRKTGRPSAATVAFTLSYEGRDPSTVQKVANVLASLFLEEDIKARTRITSTTTEFLEQEASDIKRQINDLENKISEFKEAHIGELPEHSQLNLTAFTRLEHELDRLNIQIASLEERRIFLLAQISQVEPLSPVVIEGKKTMRNPKERLKGLRLELIALRSTLSEKHPDIRKLKSEINELEAQVGKTDDSVAKVRRLNELEGQLAVLKGKLGPKHPDVIKLSREVEVLSIEVDNLVTEKTVTTVGEENADNPAYINLRTQIVSTEIQLKRLLEEKKKTEQEMIEYRRKIERAPLLERDYIELTRDYESAKHKYNEIMNKLLTARVAKGMEETQRGERFVIIEPAQLPEKPYKPNRIAILLIGFVLALGAGVGLAGVQEAVDHSVKTTNEINRLTGAPVFSTISLMESDRERRMRRFKKVSWTVAACGAVVLALVLVNNYVMPLEILWVKIQRRIMIEGFTL